LEVEKNISRRLLLCTKEEVNFWRFSFNRRHKTEKLLTVVFVSFRREAATKRVGAKIPFVFIELCDNFCGSKKILFVCLLVLFVYHEIYYFMGL
jgi:hypothetical protein